MNYSRDLTKPYKTIEHYGIVYSSCKDYNHISRYRNLRQVVHLTDTDSRYEALEVPNAFTTNTDVKYHEVTVNEINRLDLIADQTLGSATYGWVLAYFNNIKDGYTVMEGQKLKYPSNGVTALLNNGEALAPIAKTKLNLGEE